MNILFRVDSSSSIGIGHIMRDLVLAREYINDNIYFACQNLKGNLNNLVLEHGYKLEELESNSVNEVITLIDNLDIELLIIDHYEVDVIYEKEIKNKTSVKILSFDDTYEKHYCDILLNHNICADESKYKDIVPAFTELRCGENFTLIRDEFIHEKSIKTKIVFNENRIKVLLSMGGADHSNINLEILKVLDSFPNIFIDIVTTSANKSIKSLEKYVKENSRNKLHINTKNMAKLINNSDFVVISPSVVAHEVLFLEVPLIAIKTAKNQSEMYNYLKSRDYLVLDSFDKIELKNKIENMIFLIKVK